MRISDWSSDVCSSDLRHLVQPGKGRGKGVQPLFQHQPPHEQHHGFVIRNAQRPAPLRIAAAGMEKLAVDSPAPYRDVSRHALVVEHGGHAFRRGVDLRSEEHTSELQSLMRISYAVFCL